MKKLTLIRHAKSSHPEEIMRDFDRPLSGRGLNDAPLIGLHLQKRFAFAPDHIVSSPARRAAHTAEIVLREAGLESASLLREPRIYEAPLADLADVIRGFPDKADHVVLFGHNPGLEQLTAWLCGSRTVIGPLRTGGVVMLELDITSWEDAAPARGRLLTYFYPAQIGGGKDAYAG